MRMHECRTLLCAALAALPAASAAGQSNARLAIPQGQIQGAAQSPVTDQAAPRTEELICRGGSAIRIDKAGEKQTPDGTAALLTLYFQMAPGATDSSGRGLVPSSCAFIGRAWVPGDPPGVRFETPSRSSAERDVKRALHGSAAPSPDRMDAERLADEVSIPAYLSNPSHYWGFTVTKGWGYFLASRHGFVKTTFVAAGGPIATAGGRMTVARLHNVQVRPGIASARFRFIARPRAAPTIDIGRQPPVLGRDGLKVLPDQMTMQADLEFPGGREAVTWYSASTGDKGIKLDEEVDYHYVVTVPGDEKVPIQQSSGRFRTLREPIVLKVTFKRVHVIDDSDGASDGEGAFTYCVGALPDKVQEMPAFATGTDVPTNHVFVDDRWRDGPLEIAVEGIDDDAFGNLLRGGCTLRGPLSNATADQNVARLRIDTNSPSLAGRRGSRFYEMQSPNGRLRFSVSFEVDVSRPTRPAR
jgi:hypothetical protein